MLPLRYPLRWRIASAVLLVIVLAGAIAPAALLPDRIEVVRLFRHVDKWVHGVTFAFLALWFSGQYARRSYWRIALGLLLFGGCIEVLQRFVGYRSADFMDAAANTVGIAAGLVLALAGLGGWSQLLEKRLVGRASID